MDTARRWRRFLRHGMLPQLAAFETVLRLGSVTRAADALSVAQPTVSGHLRKLGETIGLPLFESRGRQLVPTEAGRALHAAACEVFASLERVDAVLGAMRAEGRHDRSAPMPGPPACEALAAGAPSQPAVLPGAGRRPRDAATFRSEACTTGAPLVAVAAAGGAAGHAAADPGGSTP